MLISTTSSRPLSCAEAAGAEYAVCGGLAMAIHGLPRATIRTSISSFAERCERVLACAHDLDYSIPQTP